VTPFSRALAAADIAVARAGGSVFELAQYGLPSVLIPYPYASADHQTTNARWMERAGAAVVIPDAELTAERLARTVAEIAGHPHRRADMAAAAHAIARPDAAADIAAEVLRAAGRRARRAGAAEAVR
jgi:UDP-N-acetylglucosamine--N-acetylmuramyl-(pentapeptide) pyrophosphoryl-undecaprenol N-acetylglucosamine transferase